MNNSFEKKLPPSPEYFRRAGHDQLDRLRLGLQGTELEYLEACFGEKIDVTDRSSFTHGSDENFGAPRMIELGPKVRSIEDLLKEYPDKVNDENFTKPLRAAVELCQEIDKLSGIWGLSAVASGGSFNLNTSFRFRADNLLRHRGQDGILIIHALDSLQYEIWASLPSTDPQLCGWLKDVRIFEKQFGVKGLLEPGKFKDLLYPKVGQWYVKQEYARRDSLGPMAEQIEKFFQEEETKPGSRDPG